MTGSPPSIPSVIERRSFRISSRLPKEPRWALPTPVMTAADGRQMAERRLKLPRVVQAISTTANRSPSSSPRSVSGMPMSPVSSQRLRLAFWRRESIR